MGNKSIFTRKNIHDDKVNLIIVRLDFSGVSNSLELVKRFDKHFPSAFKNKFELENKEINLSISDHDFEAISDNLSLPVETIKNERFTRYEGISNCVGDVWMDISKFYICMTIKCNGNYDGITNYVAPFKGAIKIFKDKIPYFQPKRLGIRKVRVDEKKSLQDAIFDFEPFVFQSLNIPLNSFKLINKEYFDIVEEDTKLRTNLKRSLGVFTNKHGDIIYRSSLDIDVYYHEGALDKRNINELLTYANEKEFEIYKSCMTFDYLKSICH